MKPKNAKGTVLNVFFFLYTHCLGDPGFMVLNITCTPITIILNLQPHPLSNLNFCIQLPS